MIRVYKIHYVHIYIHIYVYMVIKTEQFCISFSILKDVPSF